MASASGDHVLEGRDAIFAIARELGHTYRAQDEARIVARAEQLLFQHRMERTSEREMRRCQREMRPKTPESGASDYSDITPASFDSESEDSEEIHTPYPFWPVERVLDYDTTTGRYLVRWEGFSSAHDSWEPPSSFVDGVWNPKIVTFRVRRECERRAQRAVAPPTRLGPTAAGVGAAARRREAPSRMSPSEVAAVAAAAAAATAAAVADAVASGAESESEER